MHVAPCPGERARATGREAAVARPDRARVSSVHTSREVDDGGMRADGIDGFDRFAHDDRATVNNAIGVAGVDVDQVSGAKDRMAVRIR